MQLICDDKKALKTCRKQYTKSFLSAMMHDAFLTRRVWTQSSSSIDENTFAQQATIHVKQETWSRLNKTKASNHGRDLIETPFVGWLWRDAHGTCLFRTVSEVQFDSKERRGELSSNRSFESTITSVMQQ